MLNFTQCIILGAIIALILLSTWYTINWLFIKNLKDSENVGEFVAVVLSNNRWWDNLFIYLCGPIFLIKHLEKNQIDYKIIKHFDLDDFEKIIDDENCYGLYLLGHGSRHGFSISKDEVLYYCKYKDAPKIDFVVQLHCNHNGGESLADIIALNKAKSYVSDGKRSIFQNIIYLYKLYRNTA